MYYYVYFNKTKLTELLIGQISQTINRFFGKVISSSDDEKHILLIVKDHFNYEKLHEFFEIFLLENLLSTKVYISKKFDRVEDINLELIAVKDLFDKDNYIATKNVYNFNNLLKDSLIVNNTEEVKKYILGKFYNKNETYQLLNTCFLNNLNVLKTARDLIMHRNTVIYRLDSFTLETGLDPREFTDAFIIKLLINY